MYFFSVNIAFSCMDALSHNFKIWSSNDIRLSIVIPKRGTEFSDSISLLSIRTYQFEITCFADFCRSIIGNGFNIMLLFLNQVTAVLGSFF